MRHPSSPWRNPSRRLELKLELEIDARGKIVDARVEAPEEELAACVERKARRWRFGSAAPGRVRVELAIKATK